MTSVATREDCSRCNNSTEINQLSVSTEAIYKELEDSIGNVNFMNKAIEKTEHDMWNDKKPFIKFKSHGRSF